MLSNRLRLYRYIAIGFIVVIPILLVGYVDHASAQQNGPSTRYVMLAVDMSLSSRNLGALEAKTWTEIFSDTVQRAQHDPYNLWLGVLAFSDSVMPLIELREITLWDSELVTVGNMLSQQFDPGTNYVDTLQYAAEQLKTYKDKCEDNGVSLRIVLLTDTNLDPSRENQQEDLEKLFESNLMAGIEVVIIDYADYSEQDVGEREKELWWQEKLQRTGGWYMTGDKIGAADSAWAETLAWSLTKSGEPINLTKNTLPVSRPFTVDRYQKQVVIKLGSLDDTLIPTIRRDGKIIPFRREERPNNQTDLIIDNPEWRGQWSLEIKGEGTFYYIWPPESVSRQLRLTLYDSTQVEQRLPIGEPVKVKCILRDITDAGFQLSEEDIDEFRVFAELLNSNGNSVGRYELQRLPDPSFTLYMLDFKPQDIGNLEGLYTLSLEVSGPLSDTVTPDPEPSIFWGRVPKLSRELHLVSLTSPKVQQPFSVTIGLENADVANVKVALEVLGPGNIQPFPPNTKTCTHTCVFDIPSLLTTGYYTFTATLQPGKTNGDVDYPSLGQFYSPSVSVYVRSLNAKEWFAKYWWAVVIGIVLVILFVRFLVWVFGYRIRILSLRNVDSMSEFLRNQG